MPMATDAQVPYSWPLVSVGSVSDNPSSVDQTVFNLGLFESADAEPEKQRACCSNATDHTCLFTTKGSSKNERF